MSERKPKSYWYVYLAAFLFPFFGLAYGVLERSKPEADHRRRGKACLVLGIVAGVLYCLGAAAWMALGLKAGFGFILPG